MPRHPVSRRIFAERFPPAITPPRARRTGRLQDLVRQMEPADCRPRVIGIGDWAWRRGQRYGTLICDLERRQVIDLLPDREPATVEAWLSARPEIEIVARVLSIAADARRGPQRRHSGRQCGSKRRRQSAAPAITPQSTPRTSDSISANAGRTVATAFSSAGCGSSVVMKDGSSIASMDCPSSS
jgi:hypothetical protein